MEEKTLGLSNANHLEKLYNTWFLDYASYVILDRAVPYFEDGLKPVQRRVLHTLSEMHDGRFQKDGFTIVSVGRISAVKRFEAIPKVASDILKRGIRFKWYIIGISFEN